MAQAAVESLVDPDLDRAVADLQANKDGWARTDLQTRIALLEAIKDATMSVAENWAMTAARKKLIPAGSPLAGEEWLSGPYALLSACNEIGRAHV